MPGFISKYIRVLRVSYLGILLIMALFSASGVYAEEEKTEPISQEKPQSPSMVDDIWDWIKSPKLPDGSLYLGTTSNYDKEKSWRK